MKMYAIRQMGKYKNAGTSWHFTGVPGFDSERCAIKANKAEREFMKKIGYDLDEETAEYGSLNIEEKKIRELKNKLDKLEGMTKKEEAMHKTITMFMQVCLDQGYGIRFY